MTTEFILASDAGNLEKETIIKELRLFSIVEKMSKVDLITE